MQDLRRSGLIEGTAAQHGLDSKLVAAVVQKESTYDPWAFNPEPQYRYLCTGVGVRPAY